LRRAPHQFGKAVAQLVSGLVALFYFIIDLVAFFRALADITRQFQMDAVGQAKFPNHGLHLLDQFADRLAGHGVADIFDPHRGACGMVETGFAARLWVAQSARQMWQ
jgi:hypothetical protein